MDERDIHLINIHPIEREWTPDDLADWREQVDNFTHRDKLEKLHDKIFRTRNLAIDTLIGFHVLDKRLSEKEWNQVREMIRMARQEDQDFWISHGIDKHFEEKE